MSEYVGFGTLSDLELKKALLDIKRGAPEADLLEHPLMHEIARREALRLSQVVDTTGFVDATEFTEGLVNPQHNDSRWAIGSMHDHMHYENGVLVEDTPSDRGEG